MEAVKAEILSKDPFFSACTVSPVARVAKRCDVRNPHTPRMPPPARGHNGHRRLGQSGGAKTEALKSYGFHATDRRRCPGCHEERMDSDHELRRAWFPNELVPLTERLWPGKQVIGEPESLSSTRQAEDRAQATGPRRGDVMSCPPVRPKPF